MDKKTEILKKLENSIEKLDSWIKNNGWAGYDKYDLEGWKYEVPGKIRDSIIFKKFFALLKTVEWEHPLLVRKLLFIKKRFNPKALGLFLSSYSLLNRYEESIKIYNLLNNLALKTRNGIGWGYDFSYNGVVFFPKGTLYGIVTVICGEGILDFYNLTNLPYLKNDIGNINAFFINDLNRISSPPGFMFSYTNIDKVPIYNSSLWISSYLVKSGVIFEKNEWLKIGLESSLWPLKDFEKLGFLYYMPEKWNNKHIDNYHTGFNIRSFYTIWKYSGKKEYIDAVKKYYQFYLDNFIGPNGEPLRNPHGDYVESHSAAEAILVSSYLYNEFKIARPVLLKVLNWVIENMQTEKGFFINRYDLKTGKKIKIPYIRWGQAWMLRALVEAKRVLRDEKTN